ILGDVGGSCRVSPTYADIDQLNAWALEQRFPLIKISLHCFSKLWDHYQLLPIGAALGFGCGPKLVAKSPFSLSELSQKIIAIPGEFTTAHLLLQHPLLSSTIPPCGRKRFCLYHEVIDLIEKNEVDCGILIHETRFTFHTKGLYEIVDLGEEWH